MYYVVSKNPRMTCGAIHFGTHIHPIADGESREAVSKIHDAMKAHVARTPKAKLSMIRMAVSRNVLLKELIDEICKGRKLTKLELHALFDKWVKLGTPNMQNIISEEKSKTRGHGEWESEFFRLKRHSMYDYIHDSSLPGQSREKIVYIFKMLTCGVANGVDLVRRMQPRGDLQLEWVMFDHVKRMDNWTTMGIHVYDLEYRKVLTIAVCNMQCEA